MYIYQLHGSVMGPRSPTNRRGSQSSSVDNSSSTKSFNSSKAKEGKSSLDQDDNTSPDYIPQTKMHVVFFSLFFQKLFVFLAQLHLIFPQQKWKLYVFFFVLFLLFCLLNVFCAKRRGSCNFKKKRNSADKDKELWTWSWMLLFRVAPEIFGSCSGTKRPPSAAYPANPLGIQNPNNFNTVSWCFIDIQNYVATMDLFNSLYFKRIWHALNDYTSPTLGFQGFLFDFTGSFIAPDALSHSLVLHPDLHKCFKEKKHHEQHKIHHAHPCSSFWWNDIFIIFCQLHLLGY